MKSSAKRQVFPAVMSFPAHRREKKAWRCLSLSLWFHLCHLHGSARQGKARRALMPCISPSANIYSMHIHVDIRTLGVLPTPVLCHL